VFDDADTLPDHLRGGAGKKGWERASIGFGTRKSYKPNMRPEDLVMPNGLGNMRMLGMCAVMGSIITVLYVWIPLMFLNVFVPISGLTYAVTLGTALLSVITFLYASGTRETRRDRELATRL
jgi:hypothetical protein